MEEETIAPESKEEEAVNPVNRIALLLTIRESLSNTGVSIIDVARSVAHSPTLVLNIGVPALGAVRDLAMAVATLTLIIDDMKTEVDDESSAKGAKPAEPSAEPGVNGAGQCNGQSLN